MRTPTATFEPFGVVAVPFPYVERPVLKRRPALIVSAPLLAERHGLLWVAMITSAANPSWPDDVAIDDLEEANLPKPSVVRPGPSILMKPLTQEFDRPRSRSARPEFASQRTAGAGPARHAASR